MMEIIGLLVPDFNKPAKQGARMRPISELVEGNTCSSNIAWMTVGSPSHDQALGWHLTASQFRWESCESTFTDGQRMCFQRSDGTCMTYRHTFGSFYW